MNQDLSSPQVSLLVDHEHLSFPLEVTLLILVDRVIEVGIRLILLILLKIPVLHDF